MQLKPTTLGAAALALLGVDSASAAQPGVWEFDTATLIYSEADGRVQAVEPKLRATRALDGERSISAAITVDALTGASPNGAAPADGPQTFTSASGANTYETPAAQTPLDDAFRDTRVAVDGSFTTPLGNQALTTAVSVSKEYDYLSLGGSATVSRDFNRRNTTVTLGLGMAQDTIDAVGGAPAPLSAMAAPGNLRPEQGETKQTYDVLFGVTQVLSPNSLMQLSYSLSQSDGYLNDPYKLLSVVDANGDPVRYAYEARPDSRTKHALFAQYKRFVFDRDVLDLSARFLMDDWGISSQTLDLTYRWNFTSSHYLEPHLRYYTQTEADFYRAALFDGEERQRTEASADPRLGRFDALTVGLKYGQTLRNGSEWNLRLEGYTQMGKASGIPDQAAAGLQRFDLDPTLDAIMLTAGYRFSW
jgi:hypothetical protein